MDKLGPGYSQGTGTRLCDAQAELCWYSLGVHTQVEELKSECITF